MAKTADLQKSITEKIIAALESNIKPWSKPWTIEEGNSFVPFNASTGVAYRGINLLLLWAGAEERKSPNMGWVTFNQLAAKGWNLRKGSKGEKICFYSTTTKEVKNNQGETEEKSYSFLKWFTVFNMVDVDTGEGEAPLTEPAAILFSEAAKAYSEQTGVSIDHVNADRACYIPSLDAIRLPEPMCFKTEDDYAATLAHEIVHSTKCESRADRAEWLAKSFVDSKARYAFEELVAELGAAFLGAECGFSGEHLQHESYIAHWLEILKGDKTAIFRAAAKASQAVDFFHEATNHSLEQKAA